MLQNILFPVAFLLPLGYTVRVWLVERVTDCFSNSWTLHLKDKTLHAAYKVFINFRNLESFFKSFYAPRAKYISTNLDHSSETTKHWLPAIKFPQNVICEKNYYISYENSKNFFTELFRH